MSMLKGGPGCPNKTVTRSVVIVRVVHGHPDPGSTNRFEPENI